MKESKKKIALLMSITSVMSILLMLFLYFGVPQYLCRTVYGVNESDLSLMEVIEVPANTQITETFVPASNYIKSVAASFRVSESVAQDYQYITGKLLDNKGNVLSESSNELSLYVDVYDCEFEVEKWVDTSEEYYFSIEMPNCKGVSAVFVPQEAGPTEHVQLSCGNEVVLQNLYLRYTYGSYSKKLLVMYFLIFSS